MGLFVITIWAQIPNNVKLKNTLVRFKKEIRKWKPVNCPCRICKIFHSKCTFCLGFILTYKFFLIAITLC